LGAYLMTISWWRQETVPISRTYRTYVLILYCLYCSLAAVISVSRLCLYILIFCLKKNLYALSCWDHGAFVYCGCSVVINRLDSRDYVSCRTKCALPRLSIMYTNIILFLNCYCHWVCLLLIFFYYRHRSIVFFDLPLYGLLT